MARPGTTKNIKFKVLVARLGLPRPYVLGLLETLWEWAHECGNPMLGDAFSVECAAEWPGEAGKLFEALRDGRWIEEASDGKWQIHDYFDHAPRYVKERQRKELARKEKPGRKKAQRGAPTAPPTTPTTVPAAQNGAPLPTPPSQHPLPSPAPDKNSARARAPDARTEPPADPDPPALGQPPHGPSDPGYARWGERICVLVGWVTAEQKARVWAWHGSLRGSGATDDELAAAADAIAARTEPLLWPNQVLPAIQSAIKKHRERADRAARLTIAGQPRDGPPSDAERAEVQRKARAARAALGHGG